MFNNLAIVDQTTGETLDVSMLAKMMMSNQQPTVQVSSIQSTVKINAEINSLKNDINELPSKIASACKIYMRV